MRNVTLAEARQRVKAHLGKSLAVADNAQDAEINQIIYDVQGSLSSTYDWPFLKTRWDATISTGSSGRYTTFPTTTSLNATANINMERPVDAAVKWNNIWQPVIYGIDEYTEFNFLDSDRNAVLDPIQRWQFSDETKFEVWPLPASAAQMRFIGQRALTEIRTTPLTNPIVWDDTKTLDLDDLLVIYYSAAEYAMREKTANTDSLVSLAKERLVRVRAVYPSRTQPCVIGRGIPLDRKAIRQVPLVLVH